MLKLAVTGERER